MTDPDPKHCETPALGQPGRAQALRRRLVTVLLAGLVYAASFAVFARVQFASPGLPGADPYYHMKLTLLYRQQGIVTEFPWWRFTLLNDHWADKEFLVHYLFMPFTFGDLAAGGKWAAVAYASLLTAVFFLVLRANRVKLPIFWTALIFASGGFFLTQLSLARPHLWAMLLTVAGIHFVINEKRLPVFLAGIIFALSYMASYTLIGVAFIYEVIKLIWEKTPSFKLTAAAAAGVVVGLLVHPLMWNNLIIWWVQNFHFFYTLFGEATLPFGSEAYPMPFTTVIQKCTVPLLVFILFSILCVVALLRRRLTKAALALFILSLLTFAASRTANMFTGYWILTTLMAAAFVTRDLLNNAVSTNSSAPDKKHLVYAAVGLALVLAALAGYHSVDQARLDVRIATFPSSQGAALWLEEHTPAGEFVFICDWDDFAQLFFYNNHNAYTLGLDPIFTYAWNPTVWNRWDLARSGQAPDAYEIITQEFESRWVFCTADQAPFLRQAQGDRRFRLRYTDEYAFVFELLEPKFPPTPQPSPAG